MESGKYATGSGLPTVFSAGSGRRSNERSTLPEGVAARDVALTAAAPTSTPLHIQRPTSLIVRSIVARLSGVSALLAKGYPHHERS
jgi:hypothetical protein